MVFTSPPYNDYGKDTKFEVGKYYHCKYEYVEVRDDWLEWQIECIDEMMRVAKRCVIYNIQAIKNNQSDVYKLIGHYADKIAKLIVWYKPNAQPQPYAHRMGNSYEFVIIFKGQKFTTITTKSENYTNVIVQNSNSNHDYSDKHRALMSQSFSNEIIREFTKDGETVLDCFMGLATTGISCVEYNRDFIGIEIHEPYFKIAQKRMEDEVAQFRMF